MDGNMTPEEAFRSYYGDILNPETPIDFEYGWVEEDIAYCLSRNEDRTIFRVDVVLWRPDGNSWPLVACTEDGDDEEYIREIIAWWRENGIPD
jgi:hypothetical protein